MNCQLNNSTKTAHLEHLLADENYDYYEQLMKKVRILNSTTKKKLENSKRLLKSPNK